MAESLPSVDRGLSRIAFVLMPYRDPYNSYYQSIFKPALEDAGYSVSKADDLFEASPIIVGIQESILDADLVLCEMTGRSPNVFYELGLAHAVGRPAILISNVEEDIPFDLRHIRVILYNPAIVGWEAKLREDIRLAARDTESRETMWPPPLFRGQGSAGAFLSANELRLKSVTKRREIAIDGNLSALEALHRQKLRLLEAGVDPDDPELQAVQGMIGETEKILAEIETELEARRYR